MAGMLLTLKLLVLAAVVAGGGLAFWQWRDKAKQTWISIGSPDGFGLGGILDSAG